MENRKISSFYLRYFVVNMRKLLFLLIFIQTYQTHFSQVKNSVLAEGEWFKFSIDTTGVFKIDKNLLERMGIATRNVNPKKIHIYGNGGNLLPVVNREFRYEDLQENAIFVKGEEDGVFDDDDYILFYGKGPHDWIVNTSNRTASHRFNIYSDEAYYFITVTDVDGKRIQQAAAINQNPTTTITTFDDFIFYEKDEKNLIGAGTQWFFNDDLNLQNTQEFKLLFPNAVANEKITVTTRAVTTSSISSTISVALNNEALYDLTLGASSGLNRAIANQRTSSRANSSAELHFLLTYTNNGNPAANTFLDFIEVVGKKRVDSWQSSIFFSKF